MDQYRIFLLPEAQAGTINAELAGQRSLSGNPRMFHFISGAFAAVPPLGFNSASRPTSLPRQTATGEVLPQFHGSSCPHQELFLCSTKLKKFLIRIHHLKGTVWEMLKIIGLHSWIKNINKTKCFYVLPPAALVLPFKCVRPSFKKIAIQIF